MIQSDVKTRPIQVTAGLHCILALASNLATDRRLVRNFESLEIRGASDVDGW